MSTEMLPNTALEATGHSAGLSLCVGLYPVARASAWALGAKIILGERSVDLTAPFRGVKVSLKSQLEHWVELLEEWCLVHERYCRMAPGDAIFWNGERANVGALAAA